MKEGGKQWEWWDKLGDRLDDDHVLVRDVCAAMRLSQRARRMGMTHLQVCICWQDRGLGDKLSYRLAGDED